MQQCECPQYGSDRLRFRGRIEQNIALNTKNAQFNSTSDDIYLSDMWLARQSGSNGTKGDCFSRFKIKDFKSIRFKYFPYKKRFGFY